ncbi:TetR/AcrR family transcriptional regulator [Corynebacterium terpenotabidum]|uniref:TetR family transcriptional regulator n=1 Tax=Corynebacterium terpenotabidum Y-11 TaxID=1200352 RepID=S4XGV5_9CORY|nr:TetR/AcrR family transcriptional regulator [Corynebacterium terpenotabidum]AGP29883.1 TetR family transcriptional regulator [Corynebacterium terpenotabidum Y-11]
MTDSGTTVPQDSIDWLTALLTAAPEGVGRRERTRNALLQAGLTLIAAGETEVPVLAITRAAGVSNGSFYNFFDDKQQFFDEAAEVAAERFAALLDRGDAEATAGDGPDIAAMVCTNFRIIGRAHRLAPVLSKVLIHRAADYYSTGGGFISRVRRDVATGVDAGVFRVSDREGVVGTLVGATVMLGARLHDHPDLDAATTTDAVARDVLRMLGVPDDEADRVLALPLPFG